MASGKKLSVTKKCAIVTIAGCTLMIAGVTTSVLCMPVPGAVSSGQAAMPPGQEQKQLVDEPTPLGDIATAVISAPASDGGKTESGISTAEVQSQASVPVEERQSIPQPEQPLPASSPQNQLPVSHPEQDAASSSDKNTAQSGAAYEAAKKDYQQKEAAAQAAYGDYLSAQNAANAVAAQAHTLYSACTQQQPAVDGAYAAYNQAVEAYNQLLISDAANVAAQEAAYAETERLKGVYETLSGAYHTALNAYNAYLASAEYADAQAQVQTKKTLYEAANAEMEAAKQAWLAVKS